jgi:hypothetical protein
MPRSADSIDLEHLRQVVESRGWQMIRERYSKMLDGKVRELCADLDVVQTAKVRGHIEAMRTCLDVPKILTAEIRNKSGN